MTAHDRIHAREPTHDRDRWATGTVRSLEQRDGHCVITVEDDGPVELWVTLAVGELFLRRLELDPGESPAGSQVWYRTTGDG